MTGNQSKFGRLDYLKISIFGFALTAIWSSLQSIILPIRLLDFVPESSKNSYLGLLTFAGLIVAMLVQPVAGSISDRSHFKWGRRRPFILIGSLLGIIVLPFIGLANNYALLIIVFCSLQIATNIAQGSYQAFIPDLVPGEKIGLASGVKGLLEILGGVALIRAMAFLMGRYAGGDGTVWFWLAVGGLTFILLAGLLSTIFLVKEPPGDSSQKQHTLSNLFDSFRLDVKANREFTHFLIARGLMGMPGVMLQIFALYYIKDVVGIENPAASAANLLIVIGVCLIATVYPAGRLSDSIGRRPLVIASGVLGATGMVLLFFACGYPMLLTAGAVLGVANGAFISSSWAMATDLLPKGEGARSLGLLNLAMAAGSALARLMGPVIDAFNKVNPGLGYQVMLLVCFICFSAGVVIVSGIKQKPAPINK